MRKTSAFVRATVWCALLLVCAPALSEVTRKTGSPEVAVQIGTSANCSASPVTKTHGLTCVDATNGLQVYLDADGDGTGGYSSLTTVTATTGASGAGTTDSPWAGWSPNVASNTALVFPAGMYAIENASLTGMTNVAIVCQPGATFIRKAGTESTALFSGTGVTRLSIANCTFDNNDRTVLIDKGEIELTGGTDIEIVNNKWINMDGARVGYAIQALYASGASGLTIKDNLFRSDTPTEENKSAVSIVGWSGVSFVRNRFEGYGGASYQVGASATANMRDITFDGNTFVNVHAGNIMVRPSATSGYGVDGVRIVNNLGLFNGAVGANALYKGLVNCGESVGSSTAPVSHNIVIANNVAIGGLGIAIKLGDASYGSVDGAQITGNIIDGRGYTSGALDASSISIGIELFGFASRGIVVSENQVSNVAQYGVLSYASDTKIINNDLYKTNQTQVAGESSNTSPIYIVSGKNVRIEGNQIRRPFSTAHAAAYTTGGITLNSDVSVDRVVIARNLIMDDRDDGVSDIDGDGTTSVFDQRGMEYGIRVGDAGTDTINDVRVEFNDIRWPITAPYISRSSTTGVGRRFYGNSWNTTTLGFEVGSAAASATRRSCIGWATAGVYEDRDCDGTQDSDEYQMGTGLAAAIDTDQGGAGYAQVSVSGSNVQMNPNADNTQDWIYSTTVLEHRGDAATDPGAYYRSRGFMQIEPDSDADSVGVAELRIAIGGTLDATITDGDLDGNGTASSADWSLDGTADETGLAVTGALMVSRLNGPAFAGTTGSTRVMTQAMAWAAASTAGDPISALAPSVWDQWDLFRGRPLMSNYAAATSYYESTLANITQCYGGSCTTADPYLCVDSVADLDADGTRDIDPDADGTAEFKVGDVIIVGTGNLLTNRTHKIRALATGDNTNCPNTSVRVQVYPQVDETNEGVAANVKVHNAWRQRYHPEFAMSYKAGYDLALAPRLVYGQLGPNLLANGECDWDSTMYGWTVSGGTLTGLAWASDPVTDPGESTIKCSEGISTANSCFYMSGSTAADYVESNTFNVTPGERYVAACMLLTASANLVPALATDVDGDGTYTVEAGMSRTMTATDVFLTSYVTAWGQFWHTFTIPVGAHTARLRFTRGASNTNAPMLDNCSVKRVLTWDDDSMTATDTYLVPDPGAGNVVIGGDSWVDTLDDGADSVYANGHWFRLGFIAGMQVRLSRDISAQVIATGYGGEKTTDLLASTCTHTCDQDLDGTSLDDCSTGGSLSCFYEQFERYDPVVSIVHLGTNEAVAVSPMTEGQYVANMIRIAGKLRALGSAVILIPPAPITKDNGDNLVNVGDFGANSAFDYAHRYRDALRHALQNWAP